MCGDVFPRTRGRIATRPVAHLQCGASQPVLLIRHGFEHGHVGAERSGHGGEIRATPQAFDIGFASGDAAARQNASIQIIVVNVYLGVRRGWVIDGTEGQRFVLLFECQRTDR